MQTIKLSVIVVVLVARLCPAEVVIASLTPDKSTSDLVEDLVNIVTSCYGEQIHGIGVTDLPHTLIKTLSTQHSIPVTLIDNTYQDKGNFGKRYTPDMPVQFRHKLHIFIVKASSFQKFINILYNIKYSIWWNHMASFFILDRSPRCKRAGQFLMAAWKRGILNANVMCYGDKIENMIVTFNPFTSLAPVPWKKLRIMNGRDNHPFTLFVRESRGNETICLNLDFDKAKDCGGHLINVHGPAPEDEDEPDKTHRYADAFESTNRKILSTMFHALHVIPRYNLRDQNTDINYQPQSISYSWDYTLVTYPHGQMGTIILSQFRGNKSQLRKILDVIDTNSHIGLGIAYLVTLIFLKFVVRQALVPAILNLIRITCNAGFENVSHTNASRIYLTGILFFAVTLHGIFEGNLASLLTTVIPLRNVKTFKDILDLNYTLYGYDARLWNLEPEVLNRSKQVDGQYRCTDKVRRDKSSACLSSSGATTLDYAVMYKLHVSPETEMQHMSYGIKWDSPYEKRFNTLISRLVEADVLEPWDVKCDPVNLKDFSIDQDVKANVVVKIMEFHELSFAFVILGVGLALAVISFIVELIIHYICKPIWRRILGPRFRSQRRDGVRGKLHKIEVAHAPPILTVNHGP